MNVNFGKKISWQIAVFSARMPVNQFAVEAKGDDEKNEKEALSLYDVLAL